MKEGRNAYPTYNVILLKRCLYLTANTGISWWTTADIFFLLKKAGFSGVKSKIAAQAVTACPCHSLFAISSKDPAVGHLLCALPLLSYKEPSKMTKVMCSQPVLLQNPPEKVAPEIKEHNNRQYLLIHNGLTSHFTIYHSSKRANANFIFSKEMTIWYGTRDSRWRCQEHCSGAGWQGTRWPQHSGGKGMR